MRRYRLDRDESGQVCRMVWLGDEPKPVTPTREETQREKWAQWTGRTAKRLAAQREKWSKIAGTDEC